MRIAIPLIVASVVAAGCASDRHAEQPVAAPPHAANASTSTPVTTYCEGGIFTLYYGEEAYDGRIYVFGSKVAHDRFRATHQADPLTSKTYIRRGPHQETVIVQTDQEQPQLTNRIWNRFRERHHLS